MDRLWAMLMFWKAPKSIEVGKDFSFHDFEDSDLTGILILRPKYENVIYYYTNASIEEVGMGARLKFGYQIVKSGNHNKKDLENSEDFVTLLGDILSQIILTETQIESPRKIYSEESDL
jgi:hypothetical protein